MADRLPTKIISPVARPVDTYARPQAPYVAKPAALNKPTESGRELQGVADALAAINPKLTSFFKGRNEDYIKDRGAFGAGLAHNSDNWNKALDWAKKNASPDDYQDMLGKNPHIRRGFNKASLESATVRYGAALSSSISKNPDGILDNEDPEALNTWVKDWSSTWMEANGINGHNVVDIQDHFVPRMQQYQASTIMTETSNRNQDRLDEFEMLIGKNTTLFTQEAILSPEWIDNPAVGAQILGDRIGKQIEAAKDGGFRDVGKLNDQAVLAITSLAESQDNPDILNALNFIKVGGKSVLSDIPKQANRISNSRATIQAVRDRKIIHQQSQSKFSYWEKVTVPFATKRMERAEQDWANSDKTTNEKNYVQSGERLLTLAIMADPTKDWTTDERFKKITAIDNKAASRLVALSNALISNKELGGDDVNALKYLRRDIMEEGAEFSTERITDAFNSGRISVSTMQSLWDDASRAKNNRFDPFLSDERFKRLEKGLYGSILKGVEGSYGASAIDASMAVNDLYDYVEEWRADPANAGRGKAAFFEAMRERVRSVATSYNPDLDESKNISLFGKPEKTPTVIDIEKLRANPDKWLDFDQLFGAGQAYSILRPEQ